VSLGEYPKVRYYKPRNPTHEASVLSTHLARFVQEELDSYAQWNKDFPAPSNRPQGVLIITDRSMDLMAPLVHEFTYQAMAHDLLPIKDVEKPTFHMKINEGTPEEEEKDMELHDKDKVWVENRHRHMKDTIDKLMDDFNKFISQNPNFTNGNQDTTSINAIKDMMAGLPQFQEMKEAYSLHLTMTQQCMDQFEHHKLPDLASVEQTLATGVDEDFKKPKNILVEVVRLLDDEAISHADRLRLIMAWIIYRDGVIPEDIRRLLSHAGLPPSDAEVSTNLELLGARTTRELKEVRPAPLPLFPRDKRASLSQEDYALSRFEPALKRLLDNLSLGTLDQTLFPYVKPPLDPNEDAALAQTSLRAAAPRWAGAGRRVVENRQRYIVFVAGGATYSEARSCYEISALRTKDVFLATSHMLNPQLFLRQVRDLSVDKRRLDLPQDRPKPKAPAHLFERPAPPPQQRIPVGQGQGQRPPPMGGIPSGVRPPTKAMGNMNLGPGGGGPSQFNGPAPTPPPQPPASSSGKPQKPEKEKEKEHKKRRFLGLR
jgi:syntaxin-binding protein 1